MRLEGALYSSSAGLNAHGQAISVVGDNISNTNTVGFKRSRTEFSDLLAEPDAGRDPSTLVSGSGVSVNRVRPIHETGMIESTGRALDAGIAGAGFFMVGDTTDTYYTRAGNFQMRSDGVLATSEGLAVLGYPGTSTTLGPINLLDLKLSGQATSNLTLYGNLDASAVAGSAPADPAAFSDLNKAASGISVVEVYDSLGATHAITLASTKTGPSAWTVQAYIDGGDVAGGTAGKPQLLGSVNITFGPDGAIPEGNKAAAAITLNNVQYANGGSGASAKIDLGNMSQFAAPTQISGISKDGRASGQVKDYEIEQNGAVTAVLDNGNRVLLGTLQLATFKNVDGLQRIGNSLYTADTSAGERITGSPGTSSLGKLSGAALERSTVDIANEFIDLVLYQRGYQANSQVLNVATSMIKDTINMMR